MRIGTSDELIPMVDGVCVVDGFGIKITVERGHLHISDGTGRNRRQRRFNRSERQLKRLVLIGHTGYITLDALRWINDTEAAFIHIDEGQLLTTSTPRGPIDGRLRRAQALLANTPAGLNITRSLITDKLRGQTAIHTTLTSHDQPAAFGQAFDTIRTANNRDDLRAAEAKAARAYWQTIADLPVNFAAKSKPVPDHWHTVGVRTAGTSGRAQSATTPAQAIWNYCYAIAEAEVTLACHAFGLDPTLGIDHTDRPYRNSLSLDIIEPLRPHIDAYILQLLHERRFDPDDFTETRQGVTRVNPPLTHELIAASAGWRTEVINRVRHTASLIVDGKIRVSGAKEKNNQPTDPELALKSKGQKCRGCGIRIPATGRKHCRPCGEQYQAADKLRIPAVGTAALAEWKKNATPEQLAAIAKKKSDRSAQHHAARRHWRDQNPDAPTDPAWYEEHVKPHLKNLTRAQIIEATGFTPSYASGILNGNKTPHPMHWRTLVRATAA